MQNDDLDLSGIHILPPEDEDFIDRGPLRDWNSPEPPRLFKYTLPAMGLAEVERNRYGIHVVDAHPNAGKELAEALGKEALLVNGKNFSLENLIPKIDLLAKRGPCRVVFHNLGAVHPDNVYNIEQVLNRKNAYPIKNVYFVDHGEDVDPDFKEKVLMQCSPDRVDSSTLLDAVAFGWGAKNPYTGEPVTPEAVNRIAGTNGMGTGRGVKTEI